LGSFDPGELSCSKTQDRSATTLTGTVLHEYGYDAVGNRTSKSGPLGRPTVDGLIKRLS
jgi:hypothetical protein